MIIWLYGIEPEEVVVFGEDSAEDNGMYRLFGYCIAAGNAQEPLKANSKLLIPRLHHLPDLS